MNVTEIVQVLLWIESHLSLFSLSRSWSTLEKSTLSSAPKVLKRSIKPVIIRPSAHKTNLPLRTLRFNYLWPHKKSWISCSLTFQQIQVKVQILRWCWQVIRSLWRFLNCSQISHILDFLDFIDIIRRTQFGVNLRSPAHIPTLSLFLVVQQVVFENFHGGCVCLHHVHEIVHSLFYVFVGLLGVERFSSFYSVGSLV